MYRYLVILVLFFACTSAVQPEPGCYVDLEGEQWCEAGQESTITTPDTSLWKCNDYGTCCIDFSDGGGCRVSRDYGSWCWPSLLSEVSTEDPTAVPINCRCEQGMRCCEYWSDWWQTYYTQCYYNARCACAGRYDPRTGVCFPL